jgi:hypothetical protein
MAADPNAATRFFRNKGRIMHGQVRLEEAGGPPGEPGQCPPQFASVEGKQMWGGHANGAETHVGEWGEACSHIGGWGDMHEYVVL